MSEIVNALSSMIRAEGFIPLARFMQLALMHPKHGYYVNGDPLGQKGDFITAPEISQMFGEMIGVWLASLWLQRGKPDPFVLLELGPGRGTLMVDALRATAQVQGFHAALKLTFLESNETFCRMQKEKLKDFEPVHISDWSELPDLPLFVVANEFFDAMPIHQYKFTPHGWREIMVGLEGGKFIFVESDLPVSLPLPDCSPYYEISPLALTHAKQLSAHIAKHGGAAIIIDYGYDMPTGNLSLQAVSGHSIEYPLERPGEVDLTADVDFGALALVAKKEGVFSTKMISQDDFLRNMGIEIRVDKLKKKATPEQARQIDKDLFRLVNPSEMGTIFKVMALSSEKNEEMPGFP